MVCGACLNKMKKIAIISNYAPFLINFRAPLIKTLAARGVHVLALAPNFDDQTRAAMRALGAEPIDTVMSRTGINPIADSIDTWRLSKLLKKLRPDITFGYTIKPVIFGSIAAKLAGVPRRFAMVEGLGYVFTPGAEGFSFKRKILKRIVLWLYRIGMAQADKIIFLNPDDPAELVAAGVLPANKCFLLGGIGVDLLQWPMQPPAISPVTFMLVARLLREKGVEDYVAAARIVKNRYQNARFILLGGLDENPGSITEDDVQTWVNEGLVEWPGHTEVPPWLMQTSVFVLPSYYREGVPASTQEAMAMGRAVITTDVPGCRETVVNGENGFLIPVRNPQALAEAMMKFIEQPELIIKMGMRSRQIAEEKFDVHKINAALMQEIGLL